MAIAFEKLTVAVPPDLATVLREAVSAGDYGSSSEIASEALHEWEQKRYGRAAGSADLRKLWQEACRDRSAGLEPDAVFDSLEQKYQNALTAASTQR